MKTVKYEFFVFVNFLIIFNSLNSYFLAETNQNSIIKFFCLQSVKEEIMKAEMEYSEDIANETCTCYFEEFTKTASHQNAKKKCKLEFQKILNHNGKI